MELLVRPRQSGKTTELIEWCAKSPRTRMIVVADQREKQHVMLLAERLGLGATVVAVHELRDRSLLMGREVAIDELEHVLYSLVGNVQVATMTTNNYGADDSMPLSMRTQRALADALVASTPDGVHMYTVSAQFKATIDTLVQLLPMMLSGLALDAYKNRERHAQRLFADKLMLDTMAKGDPSGLLSSLAASVRDEPRSYAEHQRLVEEAKDRAIANGTVEVVASQMQKEDGPDDGDEVPSPT